MRGPGARRVLMGSLETCTWCLSLSGVTGDSYRQRIDIRLYRAVGQCLSGSHSGRFVRIQQVRLALFDIDVAGQREPIRHEAIVPLPIGRDELVERWTLLFCD